MSKCDKFLTALIVLIAINFLH